MHRPRIAHLLNTIGLGGVPEACFHLLGNLPPDRYDLRVYVLRRAGGEDDARAARLGRFEEIGVPVAFPAHDGDKLAAIGQLADWLMRHDIELLHTHSYKPNLYGRLAGALCQRRGLRMLAHYHNQYDNKWEADGTQHLDRSLADCSDGLVACSKSVADHVAASLGVARDRVTVVANGVEAERFACGNRRAGRAMLGLAEEDVAIGLVGRISEQKGQEEFIRAAARIAPHFPQARFLVIGSADAPALLASARALVAGLGLGERVRFAGHVADMPAAYAALDILAAPSRWEGFGLMLVEAMAAGKPIVATRVGAIPEVCAENETALLVPPRDPDALADALLALLRDPARARDLGAAGRQRAALFSWARSGAALDALYQRLLSDRSMPT